MSERRWQVKDISEESIRAAVFEGDSHIGSLDRLQAKYPDCPPKVILRAVEKSRVVDWGVSVRHYWIVDPDTGYAADG